jgi:hypothetical protein
MTKKGGLGSIALTLSLGGMKQLKKTDFL